MEDRVSRWVEAVSRARDPSDKGNDDATTTGSSSKGQRDRSSVAAPGPKGTEHPARLTTAAEALPAARRPSKQNIVTQQPEPRSRSSGGSDHSHRNGNGRDPFSLPPSRDLPQLFPGRGKHRPEYQLPSESGHPVPRRQPVAIADEKRICSHDPVITSRRGLDHQHLASEARERNRAAGYVYREGSFRAHHLLAADHDGSRGPRRHNYTAAHEPIGRRSFDSDGSRRSHHYSPRYYERRGVPLHSSTRHYDGTGGIGRDDGSKYYSHDSDDDYFHDEDAHRDYDHAPYAFQKDDSRRALHSPARTNHHKFAHGPGAIHKKELDSKHIDNQPYHMDAARKQVHIGDTRRHMVDDGFDSRSDSSLSSGAWRREMTGSHDSHRGSSHRSWLHTGRDMRMGRHMEEDDWRYNRLDAHAVKEDRVDGMHRLTGSDIYTGVVKKEDDNSDQLDGKLEEPGDDDSDDDEDDDEDEDDVNKREEEKNGIIWETYVESEDSEDDEISSETSDDVAWHPGQKTIEPSVRLRKGKRRKKFSRKHPVRWVYYYPQDQKPPVTATRQHKNAEQGNDKGDKEIKPSEGMEILIQRHGLIPMKCNNYTFFSMPCRLCDYRVKRHYNMPKHLTQHVNHCLRQPASESRNVLRSKVIAVLKEWNDLMSDDHFVAHSPSSRLLYVKMMRLLGENLCPEERTGLPEQLAVSRSATGGRGTESFTIKTRCFVCSIECDAQELESHFATTHGDQQSKLNTLCAVCIAKRIIPPPFESHRQLIEHFSSVHPKVRLGDFAGRRGGTFVCRHIAIKCHSCMCMFGHFKVYLQHLVPTKDGHGADETMCPFKECLAKNPLHPLGSQVSPELSIVDDYFVCVPCDQKFRFYCSFQRHVKAVHSGDKPVLCKHCYKSLRSETGLTMHMRHFCVELQPNGLKAKLYSFVGRHQVPAEKPTDAYSPSPVAKAPAVGQAGNAVVKKEPDSDDSVEKTSPYKIRDACTSPSAKDLRAKDIEVHTESANRRQHLRDGTAALVPDIERTMERRSSDSWEVPAVTHSDSGEEDDDGSFENNGSAPGGFEMTDGLGSRGDMPDGRMSESNAASRSPSNALSNGQSRNIHAEHAEKQPEDTMEHSAATGNGTVNSHLCGDVKEVLGDGDHSGVIMATATKPNGDAHGHIAGELPDAERMSSGKSLLKSSPAAAPTFSPPSKLMLVPDAMDGGGSLSHSAVCLDGDPPSACSSPASLLDIAEVKKSTAPFMSGSGSLLRSSPSPLGLSPSSLCDTPGLAGQKPGDRASNTALSGSSGSSETSASNSAKQVDVVISMDKLSAVRNLWSKAKLPGKRTS